jgi:hypothetical protein
MVTLILSQPVWDTGWIVLITAAIVITGFAVYLLTIVFAPVIGYGRLAYRNRKQPIIGPTFKKKETNMFGDE